MPTDTSTPVPLAFRLPLLYHWSPADLHDEIREHGLVPYSTATCGGYRAAHVALSPDPTAAWDAAAHGDLSAYDLWQITAVNAGDRLRVTGLDGDVLTEVVVDTPIAADRLWWVGRRARALGGDVDALAPTTGAGYGPPPCERCGGDETHRPGCPYVGVGVSMPAAYQAAARAYLTAMHSHDPTRIAAGDLDSMVAGLAEHEPLRRAVDAALAQHSPTTDLDGGYVRRQALTRVAQTLARPIRDTYAAHVTTHRCTVVDCDRARVLFDALPAGDRQALITAANRPAA